MSFLFGDISNLKLVHKDDYELRLAYKLLEQRLSRSLKHH